MAIIVLFVVFIILLLVGAPIYVSLSLSSLAYLALTPALTLDMAVKTMAEGLNNFTLLSIPLFILAGNIMNQSGMTTRLFRFARSIVGGLDGGLAHVNVLTSVLFAGMSGSAIADAGGIGSMQITAMEENGFDTEFSIGITASSYLIGPIIPPSIPMLVYAVLASSSITALFAGGVLPGILMALALMVQVYIVSKKRHYPRDEHFSVKRVGKTAIEAFWGILAPVILLGGILTGIFTATEGAAIVTIYSLIIGLFVYRGLTAKKLMKIFFDTCETTITITLILAASALFAWILAYEGLPQKMAQTLLSLTNNPTLIMLLITVLMLIVGTFMEAGAAMAILLPVILPVIDAVGISRIHLGVSVVLTLMIGLLTPPVGMVLFVLAKTRKVSVQRVIKGTMPFLIPLAVVALLVALIPQISLLIPSLLA